MKRTRYCQLISEVNKEKGMEWCLNTMISNDLELSDVIWTDECSVQFESHRKITYHKHGEPSKMVSRPKHPPKVHVWAGISAKGATAVDIFTGILTTTRYTDILDAALPFIKELLIIVSNRITIPSTPADGPKTIFRKTTSIGGKRQPPARPIENAWGTMKNYLRSTVKPKNTRARMGIKEFWKTMTPEVCKRYVKHLRKVIPKVIEVEGAPSGY